MDSNNKTRLTAESRTNVHCKNIHGKYHVVFFEMFLHWFKCANYCLYVYYKKFISKNTSGNTGCKSPNDTLSKINILKEPLLVQKQTIPQQKALDFSFNLAPWKWAWHDQDGATPSRREKHFLLIFYGRVEVFWLFGFYTPGWNVWGECLFYKVNDPLLQVCYKP